MAFDYTVVHGFSECRERYTKKVSELVQVQVDFTDALEGSEVLTGTPTATVSPAGPTVGSKAVNSSTSTVNGRAVAASVAVTFTVTGGTANVDYTVQVATASATQTTLMRDLILRVEAD